MVHTNSNRYNVMIMSVGYTMSVTSNFLTDKMLKIRALSLYSMFDESSDMIKLCPTRKKKTGFFFFFPPTWD